MVRMGKKACRFEDFIDELMHGKFFTVIVSECMRLFSIGSQGCDNFCANCVCALVCGFHQKRSAASSLNDGDKHRSWLQADDGVHLVLSETGSIFDYIGSCANAALPWNASSSLTGRVTFAVSANLVA